MEIWIYSILSVFIISIISFVGLISIPLDQKKLKKFMIYSVSFSAGALIGDAFLHLLPEIIEEVGFGLNVSLSILLGIIILFIIEKFVHWHHCHGDHSQKIKPFAIMNLVGDIVHNFMDGIIIGVSYLVSIPVGLTTTFAVALHEIPQEIGDFGVLVQGGLSKFKAVFFNFLSGLTAVIGVIVALLLTSFVEDITSFFVPLAVGYFIYISVADLIPELHKETRWDKSLWQLIFFLGGILVMLILKLWMN